MQKVEKWDYIFGHHKNAPIQNRFAWVEQALLGDIQTLVDGITAYLNNAGMSLSSTPRGGGNLSVPILVNTGLELVSALYVGKTKYMGASGYNASDNVMTFVNRFFPGSSKHVPRLLWDGIRNGVDHLFHPKAIKCGQDYVEFTFYVQDSSVASQISKQGDTILIRFNSIEFYEVMKKAVSDYRKDLETDDNLQNKFIAAWDSIEQYEQDITKNQQSSLEVDYLLAELKKSNSLYLFR